ncbi:MAG: VOC family protein [Bacteriovorax sp.]|nr:VOC family protein [Bacteriovorax sp.]
MDVDENLENMDMRTSNEKKGIQVKSIPDEYAGATPYLYVNMAEAALEFYQKAFGAKVLVSIKDYKNRIAHSEIQIGKARIMISDEFPELDCYSPRHLGGTTSGITLFFEDSDKIFKQAIAAGAKELGKMEDQFCGDLSGKIVDPFGHQWFIDTRKENMSYEEMKKRGEQLFRKH